MAMAVKSPITLSPNGNLKSSFSPWTDSPSSPAAFPSSFSSYKRASNNSDSLAPPASPYPQHVDPSPTDSNGTEGTEIDEDAQESAVSNAEDASQPVHTVKEARSPISPESLARIDTQLPPHHRSNSDDAPQSVIHVPPGFKQFDSSSSPGGSAGKDGSTPTVRSENTVRSPVTPDAAVGPKDSRLSETSSINTILPPATTEDRSTPRAHTLEEAEELSSRSSLSFSSLDDIPEATDDAEKGDDGNGSHEDNRFARAKQGLDGATREIEDLKTALAECWTLCNTLANMSSNHRSRMFNVSNRGPVQEHAWRSCWRLCQHLYDTREDPVPHVQSTLELSRDFCAALFDARYRADETSDSVLRVSFELNNHLYNIHDRHLPQAFRERTLDFYVTLSHRLMKQQTSLPQETDSLLRACWSLTETLFTLRQSHGQGRAADEETLGSAVQACWDLCDLFRDGWSQIRPDRGTPRPCQTTFPKQSRTTTSQSNGRSSSLSNRSYHDAPSSVPPETPVTIFDDTTATSSPDSVIVPNILVLGPSSSSGRSSHRGTPHHDRWSSNASTLSDASESASSQRTSSTATTGGDQKHLIRLRSLILKAAMDTGFSRKSPQSLQAYVKEMPPSAFGSTAWQAQVLDSYKKLVLADPSLKEASHSPVRVLTAAEVAKAVRWLGGNEQWAWMRDLYRLVFGFGIEDVGEKRLATIQI